MSSEDWVCSICLSNDDKDCYTLEPCGHKFHTKCIINSLRKCGPQCPNCRCTGETSPHSNEYLRINVFNRGWINGFNDDIDFNLPDDYDISSMFDESNNLIIHDDDFFPELDIDYSLESSTSDK